MKAAPAFATAAFKLKLKPSMAANYRMRHDAIWPELSQAIRNPEISDSSNFLDEGCR